MCNGMMQVPSKGRIRVSVVVAYVMDVDLGSVPVVFLIRTAVWQGVCFDAYIHCTEGQ